MSILFVLLTFLLLMSICYIWNRGEKSAGVPAEAQQTLAMAAHAAPALPLRELGFETPPGYCFHPGHTWVLDEGRQNARVGLDAFAARLIGKVDRLEVGRLNSWVRQGQKLMSIGSGDFQMDLLSPVEGVVTQVNHEVLSDPSLLTRDPYRDGWVCVVKSPELPTNLRNLVQGTVVGPWLRNSIREVARLAQVSQPALAQDGGLPVSGLLLAVDEKTRRNCVHEFFLT